MLYWDFDSEDVNESYADAVELCNRLSSAGLAFGKNITLFYSGSKGFHVVVPSLDMQMLDGHPSIMDFIKFVCAEFANGLKTFDSKIYNRNRIFRVVNSKHGKTGRYKISIPRVDLDLEEIVLMSAEQVCYEPPVPCHNNVVRNFLAQSVDSSQEVRESKQVQLGDDILDGKIGTGSRNATLASISGILFKQGISSNLAEALVRAVNSTFPAPLSHGEVRTIVRSISRYKRDDDTVVAPVSKEVMTMKEAGESWRYIRSRSTSTKLGIVHLDNLIHAFDPGQNLIIAARAKVGKTSLAMQIANNIATTMGGYALFASLEMSAPTVFSRAAAISLNSSSDTVYDPKEIEHISMNDDAAFNTIAEEWDRVLVADKAGLTIQKIGDLYRRVNSDYNNNLQCILIDYFGLIGGTHDQEHAAIAAKAIKDMAKDLNTRVILISQLSREGGDGFERVRMDMLRGTGALEEAADYILALWNDRDNKETKHASLIANRYGEQNVDFDIKNHGLYFTSMDAVEDGATKAIRSRWAK
jgi:KaiC/GvpD/RAD55 family RecA-like ATPase